ncbi:hypothetical protein EDF88_3985 [Buttiauxella sp. BIGb0552]|nr:hypothetical protein EDF88_3985 [Buttiauxella sp. BIGb0552]
MGLQSPAIGYAEKSIDLNAVPGTMYDDSIVVETSDGYALLSKSGKPKRGDTVLIQFCGGTQFAKVYGESLITEDGEAIEGDALDEVDVLGLVTQFINRVIDGNEDGAFDDVPVM